MIIEMNKNEKFDVAITGWWMVPNYGSISTYFALRKAIMNLGYSVVMLNENYGYGQRVHATWETFAFRFADAEGYQRTAQIDYRDSKKYNDLADTFVVGSDQLWNRFITNVADDLFLNFTSPSKKRIAYSTSLGGGHNFPFINHLEWMQVMKQNLNRFDAISVREQDGKRFLDSTFGVHSELTIDPVFLLERAEYAKLAEKADFIFPERYLLSFILDPDENKKQIILNVADKLGFEKIIIITDVLDAKVNEASQIFSDDRFVMLTQHDMHPIDYYNFQKAYQGASYVVTDSFHGTCFAEIWGKPFSSIFNPIRGVSRFENLMNIFGLGNMRKIELDATREDIFSNQNIADNIDYEVLSNRLNKIVEQSRSWLSAALSQPKKEKKVSPGAWTNAFKTDDQKNEEKNSLRKYLLSFKFNLIIQYRLSLSSSIERSTVSEIEFLSNGDLKSNDIIQYAHWKLEDDILYLLNKDLEVVVKQIPVRNSLKKWGLFGPYTPKADVFMSLEPIDMFEDNMIEVRNSDNNDFRDMLLENSFVFYRKWQHGDILRQNVTFNIDGTLSGTNEVNEKYWELIENKLIFKGRTGKETTIWYIDNLKNTPESFIIEGKFIIDGRTIHILESTQHAISRANGDADFLRVKMLAAKLRDYGIRDIVLSPGGRDLTLIRTFENNQDTFNVYPVTDERSSGYFALGLANKLQRPVAVVVTSGTAASNLLPAITEAYYMDLPVIAITADRYSEFHGQGEDQTIEQINMFEPMIKKSISLNENKGDRADRFAWREISDAILETTHNGTGPVHINIPIQEVPNLAPIRLAYSLPKFKHLRRVTRQDDLKVWDTYVETLLNTQNILLIYGQNNKPTINQQANIEKFASRYNVTILADWLSNIQGEQVVYPYIALNRMNQHEFNSRLLPDIVISVGGKNVMNHPINFKLRDAPQSVRNWKVSPDGKIKDMYYHLTAILETNPDWFFEYFANKAIGHTNNQNYFNAWKKETLNALAWKYDKYSQSYVTQQLLEMMPEKSLFHIGVGHSFIMAHYDNTVPGKDLEVYLNMGTNGIDGSASAFMGQVAGDKSARLKFLLIGDMSFFYDMNSLWNKELKGNIRIILVNNGGSGLLAHYGSENVTQSHVTIAKGWVESLGFTYLYSDSKETFDDQLNRFISSEDIPMFFEVFI